MTDKLTAPDVRQLQERVGYWRRRAHNAEAKLADIERRSSNALERERAGGRRQKVSGV